MGGRRGRVLMLNGRASRDGPWSLRQAQYCSCRLSSQQGICMACGRAGPDLHIWCRRCHHTYGLKARGEGQLALRCCCAAKVAPGCSREEVGVVQMNGRHQRHALCCG